MTRPVTISDAHHAWLASEAERRGCTPEELMCTLVELEVYTAPPDDKLSGWLPVLLVVLLIGVVVWAGRWQW